MGRASPADRSPARPRRTHRDGQSPWAAVWAERRSTLAKHGFDVIGLDFSPAAIKRARRRAQAEGVQVSFIVDDLTNLQHVSGTFDFITVFGAFSDLSQEARDLYMGNVLPLTHAGSYYLMMCFDNKVPREEIEGRFGDYFTIELLEKKKEAGLPRKLALHLMERNNEK